MIPQSETAHRPGVRPGLLHLLGRHLHRLKQPTGDLRAGYNSGALLNDSTTLFLMYGTSFYYYNLQNNLLTGCRQGITNRVIISASARRAGLCDWRSLEVSTTAPGRRILRCIGTAWRWELYMTLPLHDIYVLDVVTWTWSRGLLRYPIRSESQQ
ncbi:MAG: hypothetical protein BYD32DRAFT_462989 [Podila humilis]|nr:MAG: hypothetical protein BYD32DRAFT_462989 [Podila humilis]